MKIKPHYIIIVGLIILAGALVIMLLREREEKEKIAKKNIPLSKDYLSLLKAYLERTQELPESVKEQLIRLKSTYKGLNDDIALEIEAVIRLMNSEDATLSVQKLAKIIVIQAFNFEIFFQIFRNFFSFLFELKITNNN